MKRLTITFALLTIALACSACGPKVEFVEVIKYVPRTAPITRCTEAGDLDPTDIRAYDETKHIAHPTNIGINEHNINALKAKEATLRAVVGCYETQVDASEAAAEKEKEKD